MDLHHTLSDMATAMRHLGDTSPLGVRRAHALGMLARPDRVLDLFTDQPLDRSGDVDHADDDRPDGQRPDGQRADGQRPGGTAPGCRPSSRTTATLHVHVDADGLGDDSDTGGAGGVATVENLGAATLDLIRDWLGRASHLTVRPVIHQRCAHSETATVTHPRIRPTAPPSSSRGPERDVRTDPCCAPVDRHDPPPAMREAAVLRDGHCVFPGCTADARSCDLDHLIAYLDPDHGGPPGQTSLENLGCLCRRHHRLKTFTAWTHRRLPDGDYEWTSPNGRTYLAAPTPKTAPHLPEHRGMADPPTVVATAVGALDVDLDTVIDT